MWLTTSKSWRSLAPSRVDHPAEGRDRRAHADTGVPVGAHLESAGAVRVAREQRELDLGARPVARDADLLAAVERDPDGRAGGARELDRRDRLGGQVLLRAEAAPHVFCDHVHLLVLQPEALGDLASRGAPPPGSRRAREASPHPSGRRTRAARGRCGPGPRFASSPPRAADRRVRVPRRSAGAPCGPAARTRPRARAGSRASGRAPAAPPLTEGGRLRRPL